MKSGLLLLTFLLYYSTVEAQIYREVSDSIGIQHVYNSQMLMGGGCAFFDYDNDGDDDLYLSGGYARDYLYQNTGNGQFVEVGIAAGLASTANYYTFGVTTGDIDNDGDRDIFITTFVDEDQQGANLFHNNKLFTNNGNGTFLDESIQAGIVDSSLSVAASFGDVNKDGYLDIYVVNYIADDGPLYDSTGQLNGIFSRGFPNFYYINNGNGTFRQEASTQGVADTGCGLAVAFTDYDNDNDVDIYIANDFGEWGRRNTLYQNQSLTNTLTDVSTTSGTDIGLFGMGIAIGDYDEDLDLDYYVTNLGRNVLLHNNGNGTFADTTAYAGVENQYVDSVLLATGWGCAFLDYNNDSYLDLFVANGQMEMPPGFRETHPEDPNKMYHNNGDGTFTDTTNHLQLDSKTIAHGMAYSDFDNDGDLDIVVNVIDVAIPSDSTPHSLFYRNDGASSGQNWVQIDLQGTISNRDAYGSHVLVYAAGRVFLREVDGGSSHASQHSSIQHIGLGTITSVDSVAVIWPNTGREVFSTININQKNHLIEGQITNINLTNKLELKVYPNPTRDILWVEIPAHITLPNEVYIYNNLGQLLYSQPLVGKKTGIDLEKLPLPSGSYWIKTNTNSYSQFQYLK